MKEKNLENDFEAGAARPSMNNLFEYKYRKVVYKHGG